MGSEAERVQSVLLEIEKRSSEQARMLRTAYSRQLHVAWGLYVLDRMGLDRQIKLIGMPLKEWVPAKLRDERRDKPRSWAWARQLIAAFARIKRNEEVLKCVSSGQVSWWCADLVTRLAEYSNWGEKYGAQGRLDKEVEEAKKGYTSVNKQWMEARDVIPKEMVRLGGFVPPQVKEAWTEAVEIAAVIQDREPPAGKSWVWQVETVAMTLQDIKEAARLGSSEDGE